MSEKSDSNKWKEHLLKTSLPLEYLVAEKLGNKNFSIAGEYSYIRPNEHGINTEFSVDLHSYKSKNDTQLNLLIECKYSQPGTKWIFSPSVVYHKSYWSVFCLKDNEKCGLHVLKTGFPLCTRGISLYENDSNPNVIPHGLNQLRYGMPNLIFQNLKNTDNKNDTRDHQHFCVCLILVTTVNLYSLKRKQSLDTYFNAKSLEEIAEQTNALIVAQENGPLLHQYYESKIIDYIANKERMSKKEVELEYKRTIQSYFETIIPKVFRILVVNIDALDDTLKAIELVSVNQSHS